MEDMDLARDIIRVNLDSMKEWNKTSDHSENLDMAIEKSMVALYYISYCSDSQARKAFKIWIKEMDELVGDLYKKKRMESFGEISLN